jgi:tetratricopeptide (TPR) repeat protein
VAPEAYESNLKGEFVLDYKGNSRADVEQSIGYFEDAIRKDPTFALPYVGLGNAYILLSSTMFGGNPKNMHANAMTAAQKALELDPELVDAHLLLAAVKQKQYQWADAEAEYKRALELEPNNPNANFNYGLWFLSQGRIDEALAWARHAGELNPPVNGMEGMGLILFNARRYDESMRDYRDLRH